MKFSSPIAWFKIITKDLSKSIKFYETAFNITLERMDTPHMQMAIFPYDQQSGFAGGALVCSEFYDDHQSGPSTTLIYLNTDNVKTQLEKIIKLGGEEVFPITNIGENGYIAGFKDCDGNCIGLWSEKI